MNKLWVISKSAALGLHRRGFAFDTGSLRGPGSHGFEFYSPAPVCVVATHCFIHQVNRAASDICDLKSVKANYRRTVEAECIGGACIILRFVKDRHSPPHGSHGKINSLGARQLMLRMRRIACSSTASCMLAEFVAKRADCPPVICSEDGP